MIRPTAILAALVLVPAAAPAASASCARANPAITSVAVKNMGQSYTFGFDWDRSSDAGPGTTTVDFRTRMIQGSNCHPSNGASSVTF